MDELMKLVPVSASVKSAPPAVALVGEIELSVGVGFGALIVNVCAPDTPPPGVGVKTVTDAVPALAMSLAEIVAASCVLLTQVVVRSAPFHRTTDPLMKFVPVAVSVNPAPPATALLGDSALSVGARLLIVNVWALEVPPPGAGLNTVTDAVPAEAMSAAVICAVSCVLLPNVVARALPFHCTIDELMKFVPVSARVKAAPPAVALGGEIELSVGLGFGALIVNVCAVDAPPPGVGLNTVTGTVPAAAMSAAVICAVSWVLLPKVVLLALPFHRTTDEALKFVPVTVSVNAAPPAVAVEGEIEVSVGAGLLTVKV
jgi:hypothetical protein